MALDRRDKMKEESKNQEPILIYYKKADKTTNKIIIPKPIIKQWGNEFLFKVFPDKRIELIPIKKGE